MNRNNCSELKCFDASGETAGIIELTRRTTRLSFTHAVEKVKEAVERAREALAETEIVGPGSNLAFLARVLTDPSPG